jgi:hypothetical protein
VCRESVPVGGASITAESVADVADVAAELSEGCDRARRCLLLAIVGQSAIETNADLFAAVESTAGSDTDYEMRASELRALWRADRTAFAGYCASLIEGAGSSHEAVVALMLSGVADDDDEIRGAVLGAAARRACTAKTLAESWSVLLWHN